MSTADTNRPRSARARIDDAIARGAARRGDHEGARLLLSRYCMLIDQGRLEDLARLFLPDGQLSVSYDTAPVRIGRAAILAWYAGFFAARPRVRHPRHKLYEPCLVVSGTRAVASTYFDSDFVEADGSVTVFAGRYDDVLLRRRGRWFFQRRDITVLHHYSPGRGADGIKP